MSKQEGMSEQDFVTYTPIAGDSIDAAAFDALSEADVAGKPCRFEFNTILMEAAPGEPHTDIVARWERQMEQARQAYRNSPAFAQNEREREKRIARQQQETDRLLERLPDVLLAGEPSVVQWCGDFVLARDWIGVTYDRQRVIDALQGAGYAPGDCVGHPDVRTNTQIMARWIVGQVLQGLTHENGAIPPIMAKFAYEDYRVVQEEALS